MKEIIKNIYNFVDNKFYFKLLYLFVSLASVTILKSVPGIKVLIYMPLAWGMILILLMLIEDYKRRKIYKFDIPLAMFIIITLVFNIIAYRNSENIKVWIVNLILFLTIFTVDVFRNKKTMIKEMNIITYFYAIFMFIASIISLIMRFSEKTIEMGGIVFGETKGILGDTGVFVNKNTLSIATALAIVMCIYLYQISKGHKFKMFWLVNIALQTITMIGSHGRSAYLIVIAVVYIFIFVYNKNKYFRIILLLIPILAGGIFFQLDKSNIRSFTTGRSSLWTCGAIVIKEHPLVGVGNNDFIESVTAVSKNSDLSGLEFGDVPGIEFGGLHNIYVQIATVNGIISLLLFLTFLGMILMFIIQHLDKLKRKEKLQMTTLTSLVFGILVVNLFESTLIYIVSFISMIFWIYLGYLVSILDNKNIE